MRLMSPLAQDDAKLQFLAAVQKLVDEGLSQTEAGSPWQLNAVNYVLLRTGHDSRDGRGPL